MRHREKMVWLLVVGLLLLLFQGGIAQRVTLADEGDEDRAVDIARDYEPMEDALARYRGHVEAEAEYLEQWGVWRVGFAVEGREVAWVTISLEEGRVLEFAASEGGAGLAQSGDDGEVEEARIRQESLWWREWLPSVGYNRAFFYFLAALFLLVLVDLRRPLSRHNLDLLTVLLWLPGLLIFWQNLRLSFLLLFLASLYFVGRLLLGRGDEGTGTMSPNLPSSALRLLVVLLALFHLGTIANGGVDDAGIWGAKGAQFFLDKGYLPYGQFSDGDTYGPLEYLLFIPISLVLPPGELGPVYNPDNFWGARVMAMAFDLLLIVGLWVLGRRLHSEGLGLASAFGYAILPYTFMGLPFVSHIIPVAFMVWGLYFLSSPVISGALLAAAAATFFYPAFAFPLWFSWFRQRGQGWPFLLSFGLLSLALFSLVFLEGSGPGTFYESTVLNQEGTGGYGSSTIGFWGQFPALAFLKRPVLGLYLVFCASLLLWPRQMNVYQLVALTGAVVLGTQLWKSHGGGAYVGWFLPFLLLAVLWPSATLSGPFPGRALPSRLRASGRSPIE